MLIVNQSRVNSAPELEFIDNSNSGIGIAIIGIAIIGIAIIGIAIIGIELELP